MADYKRNKTIAGYHLLMILSAVDYKFLVEEDMVIREFLVAEFPFQVELDKEMTVISNLFPEEWEEHFRRMLKDFYDDSTLEERKQLVSFAIDLVKADNVVTKEENQYMRILFDAWGIKRKPE